MIHGIIPEEDTYYIRQNRKTVRLKENTGATTYTSWSCGNPLWVDDPNRPREAITGPGGPVIVIDTELDIVGMGNVMLGSYRHLCVLGKR